MTPAHRAPKAVNPWAATALLLMGNFMNLIDVSIVNVALPSIRDGLSASETQMEWVPAAYVLAFAVGLLPCGRFGDKLGRKRLFLWGVGLFTLASCLCGLAPNIDVLIGARALQGLGGAMMVPQVMAIMHVLFAPDQKARAFALAWVVVSLGAVTGPLLAGLLITADIQGLGWRPIFLVNLPVGILVVLTLAAPLALNGIGMGLAISPLFQLVLRDVPGPMAGAATGGMQAFQQVGAAVGIAVASSLFFVNLRATDDHAQALSHALGYQIAVFVAILTVLAIRRLRAV